MYPMLAVKGDIETAKANGYLCQPKLNGIRAMWDPELEILTTRNGNNICSVDHIIEQLKKNDLCKYPLDGEIYTDRISFQKINGLSRRKISSDETGVLEFHVFDVALPDMICEARISFLENLSISSHIKLVPTRDPKSKPELRAFYKEYLACGYEGIILRKKGEIYYPDRTSDLIKIKPVLDMEAELIGFTVAQEDSKNIDTFGSLILRLPGGVVFNCGGINDKARLELWEKKPLGASVTFKYGTMSDTGVPVFPRYSHIRWDTIKEAVA